MIASLLPLCLLFSSVASPQGQAPITEILPLQHFVSSHPASSVPAWGTLLQRPTEQQQRDLLQATASDCSMATEDMLNLLRETAMAEIEAGRLHINALNEALVVVGEATEVAKMRERVRLAGAVLARPLQIEFSVWDAADRETPNAFLSAADYAKFVGNRVPLARSVATARHGAAVALERMRWSRYVRDLDAEVAQKQTMTQPTTDEYGEGSHAVVRAFGLLGSDEFAVHVQFASSQRRGVVRTVQTGLPGAAEIELPLLETDCGACSGRITNGGALAVTLRGHAASGGQRIVTLRVSSRTPPAQLVQEGLGIFPCGAITDAGLGSRVPLPGAAAMEERATPGFGHMSSEDLIQFVRDAFAAEASCGAGFMFVHGPSAVLAKAEAGLRELQDRLVRNVTLAHTGTLAVVDNSGTGSAPSLHELTLPTLLGRQLTMVRVLETNVIADLHPVIAQEAGILDPSVSMLQSGCWLSANVAPFEDSMHLQLRVQQLHAMPPPARSVMPGGGVLMATEVARTAASHDGPLANGQATEHGDGPAITIDGRGYRSALATILRW